MLGSTNYRMLNMGKEIRTAQVPIHFIATRVTHKDNHQDSASARTSHISTCLPPGQRKRTYISRQLVFVTRTAQAPPHRVHTAPVPTGGRGIVGFDEEGL
jgi:hypothetical protein